MFAAQPDDANDFEFPFIVAFVAFFCRSLFIDFVDTKSEIDKIVALVFVGIYLIIPKMWRI